MAITPQVYTLTATWTAAQLANLWRQVLIDAGLMTEWYDSVTVSGYEHRILRLTNDANKTYGYQFIWLLFYTNGVWVQFANGWNPTTHVPTGTQYQDYYSASCAAATTGFSQISSLSTSSSYTVTRYTSGLNGDYTYFCGIGGFLIKKNIGTPPSWLDLNKMSAFSFFQLSASSSGTSNGYRVLYFYLPYNIRRMAFAGRSFAGTYNTGPVTAAYSYGGVNTGSDVNDPGANGNWYGAFRLPAFSSSMNPAYTSNYAPIITGINPCTLLDCQLPDDFGMTTTINAAPSNRDMIHVSPGDESWEVMANTSAAGTNGMCFVARTL